MTTVFLSGSRHLTQLSEAVCRRLDTLIEKKMLIVIGDANGADKALQTYLHQKTYPWVTVYCAGGVCRNNVGQWQQVHVDVDKALRGRAFYTVKDTVMAKQADYGFILWDGKSKGSLNNATELLAQQKPVVLWLQPEKRFVHLRTPDDLAVVSEVVPPNQPYQQVMLAL